MKESMSEKNYNELKKELYATITRCNNNISQDIQNKFRTELHHFIKNCSELDQVDSEYQLRVDSNYRNLGYFIEYVSGIVLPAYFLYRVSKSPTDIKIDDKFNNDVYSGLFNIIEAPDKHGDSILREIDNITDPMYFRGFLDIISKSPALKVMATKSLNNKYKHLYDCYAARICLPGYPF